MPNPRQRATSDDDRGPLGRRGPVRLALAMLTVSPGGMGGGETYARALTRLFDSTTDARAAAALDAHAVVPANARGFSEGIPEVVAERVTSGDGIRRRARGMIEAFVRTRSLRRLLGDAEVVYFPFTVPLPYPRRDQGVVQMLFDLQHLDLPELFSPAERIFRHFAYGSTAKRADAIITISAFTKQRIVDLLGIPEHRIHVAHLGVEADPQPNRGERGDFVLYPARAWPHKNHTRLFEAMAILRRTRPDARLVLTGGNLDELGPLPEGVEWRGLVSTAELRELYRTAAALVFPSLYEGFGLPPLEAMASGCPVATATSGSLPEICGDAAVYVDPLDPVSIAAGMDEAIRRGPELSERGIVRAAEFDWQSCRDAHIRVFESVAADARLGRTRRRRLLGRRLLGRRVSARPGSADSAS